MQENTQLLQSRPQDRHSKFLCSYILVVNIESLKREFLQVQRLMNIRINQLKFRCEATLTVVEALEKEKEEQKAPEFVIKLADKSASPKETITLECKVVGKPEPQTTWLKDGKQLTEQPAKVRIESGPDGTQKLTIEQIDTVDEANYQCVAQNPAGKSVTSANLTIKSKYHYTFIYKKRVLITQISK